MKKIVFISSTYIDLKEERKKVWECLQKFDVTVKGMEQFGARKSDPLTTCLTEVELCDIYVGIFGVRYGSEDPKSHKSFSQLEYEKAMELEKEVLIYCVDLENSPINYSHIQFEKVAKLDSFKKILKDKHTVDSFSSSQDLVSKLQRKFTELLPPLANDVIEDDYDNTKKILDLFFLVPAAYSGRGIKLKVNFIGTPQPASKAICQNFNFEFGKTIVCGITVLHPKFEFQNFKHIFIEYTLFDTFMALNKAEGYEIFANVLFKDEKAKTLVTDFKDVVERFYEQGQFDDQDYEEEPPDPDLVPVETYYNVLKVGDGQVALNLKYIL